MPLKPRASGVSFLKHITGQGRTYLLIYLRIVSLFLLASISPNSCGVLKPQNRSELESAVKECLHPSPTDDRPHGSSARISLLDLRTEGLVHAKFLRRPSSRNRSPYVADVELADGREVIAHLPTFDMGEQIKLGTDMLLRPARDSKGALVGSTAVGKHGTPKCEFIAQLARISEPENNHIDPLGVWVGAHPSLAEKFTHEMLKQGLVKELDEVVDIKREVSKVCGTDMRVDFVVTHKDGTRTALEVKKVEIADYNPSIIRVKHGKAKFQYWGYNVPYRRAAIFPWGRGNQIGPDGEKVVSSRAIKHMDELSAIQTGEKLCPEGERLKAAILFVVLRCDAQSFRPNRESCPSFVNHLYKVSERGVKVLAYRVAWGTGDEEGVGYFDGALKVDF